MIGIGGIWCQGITSEINEMEWDTILQNSTVKFFESQESNHAGFEGFGIAKNGIIRP